MEASIKGRKKIVWGKPFTVEFIAPEDVDCPWEVTLVFDKNGKILLARECCKILCPKKDHGTCPPGQCPRIINGVTYCSSAYCKK